LVEKYPIVQEELGEPDFVDFCALAYPHKKVFMIALEKGWKEADWI